MAGAPLDPETAVEDILRLRRSIREAPGVGPHIAPVIAHLESSLGAAVPATVAARVLGVSHTAVRRWIEKGELLAAHGTASKVDVDELLEVAERVAVMRQEGARHALAEALAWRLSPQARRAAERAGVTPARLAAWGRMGLFRGAAGTGAMVLAPSESEWLIDHADLVMALQETADEHSVDTLILFGSVARGDDSTASDVDLVADGAGVEDPAARIAFRAALAERLRRPVDVTTLGAAREVPMLLLSAMVDGRVVLDRRGAWATALTQLAVVEDEARAAYSDLAHRQERALAALGVSGRP
jgi:predicted nucleotidyltransferase